MKLINSLKATGRSIEKSLLPTSKPGEADILDTLKKEHEEVSDLLAALCESKSAAARKSLLKKIKAALVPHVRAEEKIVYNAIIAQKGQTEKIDGEEGYHEHDLADVMLARLSKISNAMSPEFSAGAKVLRELIEHHVEEEERNVWKDVKAHFNSDERLQLNKKFEQAKKKVRVAA